MRRGRRFVAAAGAAPRTRRSPSRPTARAAVRRRRLRSPATGSSSAPRPPACRRRCARDSRRRGSVRLPMRAGQRSLNLSNAVAVAVFEAWRQNGYAGGGLRHRRAVDSGPRLAPHQLLERLRRREPAVEHLRPRRRRSASRRRARAARRSTIGALRHAFGDVAELGQDASPAACRRRGARPTVRLRDRSPVAVSTRSPRPDRPMKVCGLGAERDAEPRHLGQPARDQRGARVEAEVPCRRRCRWRSRARS